MKAENYERLIWNEEESKEVFRCPVFSIRESSSRSPDNEVRRFTVMDAPDWVMVVPVLDRERGRCFVMVRQWRHGAGELSLEFPGGVLEDGEEPAAGAARELLEETGYAGELEAIGVFNPNPAIMSNRIHFFTAKNLEAPGQQHLDDDEYVKVEYVLAQKVFHDIGKAPYIHALTGTALTLYMQNTAGKNDYKPDNL